jgi:hypothetical protein
MDYYPLFVVLMVLAMALARAVWALIVVFPVVLQ